MKRVQRFPARHNPPREQELWDAALDAAKPEPNKYARLLRSVLLGAGGLCGLFLLMLCAGAVAFGVGPVVEYLGSDEFVFGVVMRSLLLLVMLLFGGYVLTGWGEDE
jgi:hypothetical protein